MGIVKEILYRIRGEYTTEKLMKMGMKVGKNFGRLNGVILDPSHCWLIEIGDNVTMHLVFIFSVMMQARKCI